MLPALQQWKTQWVLPRSRALLKDLSQRALQIQQEAVVDRSTRKLKDLTKEEWKDVVRVVACILQKHKYNLEKANVDETLRQLRATYQEDYESGGGGENPISESLAMKEALHWLQEFWDVYRDLIESHAFDTISQERRFLGDVDSVSQWCSGLTFHAALYHPVFVAAVPRPMLLQHPEIQLMKDVEERMEYSMGEVVRKSEKTRKREAALREDNRNYSWMGNDPDVLPNAFLYTEQRLASSTKLVNETQQHHQRAVQWLDSEAIPHGPHIEALCQFPAEVVAPTEINDDALKLRLKHYAADLMTRMQGFSKSECVDFLRSCVEHHSQSRPLGAMVGEYLHKLQRFRLQEHKNELVNRRRLIYDTCLGWTEKLLDRTVTPRYALLPPAVAEAQRFQQALTSGALSPDHEVEVQDLSGEEDEVLRAMRDDIQTQLALQDEATMLSAYDSKMLTALEKSSESLFQLSQSQWKKDLQAANTAFFKEGQRGGMRFSQNLAAYALSEHQLEQQTTQQHTETQSEAWNTSMAAFLKHIHSLHRMLQESSTTHQNRARECTRQCLESYLKPHTTGNIPGEWFSDGFLNSEAVKPLLTRALDLLSHQQEQQHDLPSELKLLRRILEGVGGGQQQYPSVIAYAKVDSFIIALHTAVLVLGLV